MTAKLCAYSRCRKPLTPKDYELKRPGAYAKRKTCGHRCQAGWQTETHMSWERKPGRPRKHGQQ